MITTTKPPAAPPPRAEIADTGGSGLVVFVSGNMAGQLEEQDIVDALIDKLSFMNVERIFAYGTGVENGCRKASLLLNCAVRSVAFRDANLVSFRPHIFIQFGQVHGGDNYKKLRSMSPKVITV